LGRVGNGSSLYGWLRVRLFLLRTAGQVAGQNQQAGTNKASQRIVHLRLIEFIFRRIDLKTDIHCIPQAKTPLVDCFSPILPQSSSLAHGIVRWLVVWAAQVWKSRAPHTSKKAGRFSRPPGQDVTRYESQIILRRPICWR
jgi:hypothetical protein